ncbi:MULTISPECIES: phosphonate C-P lyase system protein PhnH [unclassified Aureimonas]|uniref:phosphonate C-P lyase system protein PhnH n=1 Tax=unclassified Aureimonas TaxID=2615206 RepID=UPI0006FC119D|nr:MULTISPECIES: phosphonate C-P lyase system protein PhnH [unclassified Aureimonas]KQT65980.1 phosphonate C-P lyase system protein PhnH [Aureimonas sp. Leaf427]KQT73421.1 phosphonate C-P lyase system protein PhnH [Aureimonas sp. Leaf460]
MAALSQDAVLGGFADPVFDAQTVFRRIMDAMARPGTIADLSGYATGPAPLSPATAAILATLADADAPVFIEGERADEAAAWIAFQTGAAVLDDPEDAAFAVLGHGSDPALWRRLPLGDEAYPDRSATLILSVDALEGGPPLVLTGPGIETSRTVAPLGLPEGFVTARAANAALFPRGQDLVLVAGSAMMALPRTTRIEEA